MSGFGSFDSNHLALVRADGAMDLYDGVIRARDAITACLEAIEGQDH